MDQREQEKIFCDRLDALVKTTMSEFNLTLGFVVGSLQVKAQMMILELLAARNGPNS